MQSSRETVIEHLLVTANRLIRLSVQASGHATSSAAWRTLGILETDGPLRVGELAAACRVAQPTMTRTVAAMCADGLTARSRDRQDSRSQRIAITEAGRARLNELRTALTATVVPMFAELSDDQWNTLEEATLLLAAGLGTEQRA